MQTGEKKMRPWIRAAALVAIAFGAAAPHASAQHEGHGAAPKPTAAPGASGDCAARAKESVRLLDAASRRIEEARQTNNPAKMRAAVEELQRDLGEIRARLTKAEAAPVPSPTPSVTGGTTPRGDKPSPIP